MLAAIVGGSVVLQGHILRTAAAASVRSCPPESTFYAAVHRAQRRAPIDTAVALPSKLSATGEVVGRTLALRVAGSLVKQVDLAPESFASEPVGNVVVYGQVDGRNGSNIRAYDVETGCDFALFASTNVAVRGALVSAGLDALYVHSVAVGNRADRGIERIDLTTGSSRLAIPPLAAAEPFGITFATGLRWSAAGDELAVQSCGIHACRTRVLDPTTGDIQLADQPHGQLIGLTADRLFAFDTCDEMPCPLESVDRSSGSVTKLGIDAFAARLELVAGSPVLVADTPAGSREIKP